MNVILENSIREEIDWLKILTKHGDTQNSERYYISVIKNCIERMGGTIGAQAGAQQSVDIRDVQLPNGDVCSYECKKVNKGQRFMFNDTFLKQDVWYILIYSDKQQVRIEKGQTLIEENIVNCLKTNPKYYLKNICELCILMLSDDEELNSSNLKKVFSEVLSLLKCCVIKEIISFFEFGEMFKTNIMFGNFTSRPRPNWNLTIPFVQRAIPQPPESSEEAPHSPIEQPDSSDSQKVDSLVESLGSLSIRQ